MWLSTTNTSKMVVERLGTRFRSTGRICNWNNAFRHCRVESKKEGIGRALKYWKIIADNLKKRGWSYGYVSALDSWGRTIWIADAHRGDGKRFVVHADELLTAFLELQSAVRVPANLGHYGSFRNT